MRRRRTRRAILGPDRTAGRGMARVEGTHAQGGGGRVVRYHADYEVSGHTIRFRAWFDGGSTHEGEFDFDPTQLAAAAAVDAFLHNHIEKADWDTAP